MTDKKATRVAPVVKALRIVLITLLILYGLVFISFTAALVGTLIRSPLPPSGAVLWDEIRVLLEKILTTPFYFFIAYCIFKLIALISRGESFSPASPWHIRRIGYAVFGLALLHIAAAAIYEFTAPEVVAVLNSVIRTLYGGLSTLLLGFGFLVIAKVLEVGVRLQQDQNLTV